MTTNDTNNELKIEFDYRPRQPTRGSRHSGEVRTAWRQFGIDPRQVWTTARTTGVRSMARKIAKKEYSYTHGQLFSRISAVMKFVAEGPRGFSACARPIRAGSAQVLAHRTPTRAHASTATGKASPQYEFPTFSEHSFRLWGSPISRSVEGRALTCEACVGECHGVRVDSSAGQLATRCEQ